MKKEFPIHFQTVVNFLKEKNVDVEVGNFTCFWGHTVRRITIDYRFNFEKNGLFALLHETGHVLQPSDKSGVNRYMTIDEDDDPKEFKMFRFINEVDAWQRGLSVAEELGIPINMKAWDKLKKESLLTYYF